MSRRHPRDTSDAPLELTDEVVKALVVLESVIPAAYIKTCIRVGRQRLGVGVSQLRAHRHGAATLRKRVAAIEEEERLRNAQIKAYAAELADSAEVGWDTQTGLFVDGNHIAINALEAIVVALVDGTEVDFTDFADSDSD